MHRSCRLLQGQSRQPFKWNYFPLLTRRIVLSNKIRNLRKYSVGFLLNHFPKKKVFGGRFITRKINCWLVSTMERNAALLNKPTVWCMLRRAFNESIFPGIRQSLSWRPDTNVETKNFYEHQPKKWCCEYLSIISHMLWHSTVPLWSALMLRSVVFFKAFSKRGRYLADPIQSVALSHDLN